MTFLFLRNLSRMIIGWAVVFVTCPLVQGIDLFMSKEPNRMGWSICDPYLVQGVELFTSKRHSFTSSPSTKMVEGKGTKIAGFSLVSFPCRTSHFKDSFFSLNYHTCTNISNLTVDEIYQNWLFLFFGILGNGPCQLWLTVLCVECSQIDIFTDSTPWWGGIPWLIFVA